MNLRRHLVVVFVLFAFGLIVATFVPFGILSSHGHLRSYIDDQLAEAQRVATTLERGNLSPTKLVEHYEGTRNAGWLLDAQGREIGSPTERRAFPALVKSAPEVESARRGTTAERIDDS